MSKSRGAQALFKPTAMSISKEHGRLDKLIEKFALSSAPEQLQFIFNELGLMPYYDHAVAEATKNAELYLDSPAVPSSWFDCALNAYEGAMWEELPREDIGILVVAALYHRMKNALYELKIVDGTVPERTASAFRRASIINTLNKATKKLVATPAACIACDAAMMQVYTSDTLVVQHFSGAYMAIQESRRWEGTKFMATDFFLYQQVAIQRSYVWKTRWGRKKALLLNHPAQVERMKELMLAALPKIRIDNDH